MKQYLLILLSLFLGSNIFGGVLPPFWGYYCENKTSSDIKIILAYGDVIDILAGKGVLINEGKLASRELKTKITGIKGIFIIKCPKLKENKECISIYFIEKNECILIVDSKNKELGRISLEARE